MRETNLDAKFELFQRLNSGGTVISGQELRNAILAGERPEMLTWLEELADDSNFVKVIGLSERDKSMRYDMELALRFMALLSKYKNELKDFNSVDVFLTHVLRKFIKDSAFNFDERKKVFQKTFKKIADVYGENALKFKTAPKTGGFSISFFEAVALGIAQNINKLPADAELKKRIDALGKDAKYKDAAGSGKNASYRIPRMLELGKEYFKKA